MRDIKSAYNRYNAKGRDMKNYLITFLLLYFGVVCLSGCTIIQESQPVNSIWNGQHEQDIHIISPSGASGLETLAAREVRRYIYLRTGRLLPIEKTDEPNIDTMDAIVVSSKSQPVLHFLKSHPETRSSVSTLSEQEYLLKTLSHRGQKVVLIIGGDAVGTLYSAYQFAEQLGVGFYLHGDAVPDARVNLVLPNLDERSEPLFTVRGILPFHDFPEGPDWWSLDGYKAILAQLPKLRMNFIGLHTYPEGAPNAEPTVWIGLPEEVNDDGTVRYSYPASYFSTFRGNWGYEKKKTSDYSFGAAMLYPRDGYGAEVMNNFIPRPDKPAECNELFNRTGWMLDNAFRYAEQFGIQTCVGTESPLTIPSDVKEQLRQKDMPSTDSSTIRTLYEGIFRRIMHTHPLDYYWLWTPEGWTWSATTDEQIRTTRTDLEMACAAADAVNVPFKLATCGWVLGPRQDRTMFDRILPRDVAMSCINRFAGKAPLSREFKEIKNRPTWAIPWLEDDAAFCCPQLWAGRMRRDAVDARKYNCTGLLGIHWRTRILSPNVAALANAAWEQDKWNTEEKAIEDSRLNEEGPLGGVFARFYGTPIKGTADDEVYQTVRYDFGGYRLNVPNGTYTVTLNVCEPHFKHPGKRVFGIKIQSKTVMESLDIFKEAGLNTALDVAFENIKVTDNLLTIEFKRIEGNPCIAGVVVEGDGYSRKINCAGNDYKDYAEDWAQFDGKPRSLPADDLYRNWAERQFGTEIAVDAAALFARLDGELPRPFAWVGGPGGLLPDARNWKEIRDDYSFVDEFEQLRQSVKGRGNLERFDYWLNHFRHTREAARIRTIWSDYNRAVEEIRKYEQSYRQKLFAQQTVLPLRKKLVRHVKKAYNYLLATVSTPAELGTIANWEQHILPGMLERPGKELEKILGEPLPPAAQPSKIFSGTPRIVVPTPRTHVARNEILQLDVLIMDTAEPKHAALYWREMGEGSFTKIPLTHVARSVYTVSFPARALQGITLEYYIDVTRANGKHLYFPVTAPELNQTVVITE